MTGSIYIKIENCNTDTDIYTLLCFKTHSLVLVFGKSSHSNKNYLKLIKMENDFKNFVIRRITPKDYDGVCAHAREFFIHDEITSKTLGVTEDYANEFELLVLAVLGQNQSFMAQDKETGDIANLRLTYIHKKDENIFSKIDIKTYQIKITLHLFNELDKLANVFEKYNVHEYAFFFVASTNPKYRNQGLTKEMYLRSLKLYKKDGIKLAKVFTSSPYSKAATLSLGFEEVGRIDYKDLKDSEGNSIFKPSELTTAHVALVKIFQLDKL